MYSPVAIRKPIFRDSPPPTLLGLVITRTRESSSAILATISRVLSVELSLTMIISMSFKDWVNTVLSVSEIYSTAL